MDHYSVAVVVNRCREAKKAYETQNKLVFSKDGYNGRYAKKAKRLYIEWKKLEGQLLKTIYQ